MIGLWNEGAYWLNGRMVPASQAEGGAYRGADGQPLHAGSRGKSAQRTIAGQILKAHSQTGEGLRLRFDSLASHDITYVGIIQTLRAATEAMSAFPLPYVLSNCHNSLCAVGGTINADDHAFGLSAARKYGGIFVPPHVAVIHQYMRETMAACGHMILGSDSHTRYGALGTLGVGEGGGELVKQLLNRTYDLAFPGVVGVCLTGEPQPGVGPQDVALALIGAVFENGYVKNKVMEFIGDGVGKLSVDFRNGIDVMTTETACWSSVWVTDAQVEAYYRLHGRADAYRALSPGEGAYYDGLITVDLSAVKPMIALPFHPSHVYEIDTLNRHAPDIFAQIEKDRAGGSLAWGESLCDGRVRFAQGIIAGCAGGMYENLCQAADILEQNGGVSGGFPFSVYPASQPVYLAMVENGVAARLMRAGAVLKTAFCGPCFGAGDTPAHNGLSARHVTRNFPNREGSKPNQNQGAGVALMDARSIAATAANGGKLTAASGVATAQGSETGGAVLRYFFDSAVYAKQVYTGYGRPDTGAALVRGPGIADWPALQALSEDMLITVASLITDPVTTTDELIPSGETSSYRSNPVALAAFTLSRRDPGYVARAQAAAQPEQRRLSGACATEGDEALAAAVKQVRAHFPFDAARTAWGSLVYAVKPGDGSAREQAASCQRVLGGRANIAREYATRRYRSNLINWGLLPFVLAEAPPFAVGDRIYIPGVRDAVANRQAAITAYVVGETLAPFTLTLPALTAEEAEILLCGGLINYYRTQAPCPPR